MREVIHRRRLRKATMASIRTRRARNLMVRCYHLYSCRWKVVLHGHRILKWICSWSSITVVPCRGKVHGHGRLHAVAVSYYFAIILGTWMITLDFAYLEYPCLLPYPTLCLVHLLLSLLPSFTHTNRDTLEWNWCEIPWLARMLPSCSDKLQQ